MSGLTILSFVVLPVGLVLTVCALSGIRFMEELAYNFCRFKLSFGETCHVRLVAILLWICFFLFAHESWKLSTVSMSSPCMLAAGGFVGSGKGSSGKMSFVLRALGSLFGFTGGGAREDEGSAFSTAGGGPGVGAPAYIPVNVGGSSTLGLECKAYRWRHERNWWIGSVNLIVWLTLWRLSAKLHSLAQENRTLRERVLTLTGVGTKDNVQRLPVEKSSQSGSSSSTGARSQQPGSASTDKDTSGIELTTRRRTAERDDNHHTSSSRSGDTTRAAELKKGSKAQ